MSCSLLETPKPLFYLSLLRHWQLDANLETTPDRAVKQLGMVAGRDDNYVAGKMVDLKQQRTHHTLDLSGLMYIAPLLSNNIKLIEKEYAVPGSRILENLTDALGSLPKEAAYDPFVTNNQQWNV